ncbi:DoxX family protein [Galbibacter pacificus]|uniref:DoxX family protein n=1 Tax=Galbibacter pacificus TaxID=2996052 RepID=A0ABT6FRU0_9FLAO|nr:DoxX family protein [Galbibacter pacificus]MDG3582890.1 DoxX family protein [Galbibacter pacificus]MDG3585991.1 DoxX family protein [Galbibacter pacificus]
MVSKISSTVLILVILFMGIKQGLAMVTGKPEMLEMFGKWGFNKTGVMVFGVLTLLSTALIAIPKTFIWGNFLMAATILLIICFQLFDGNLKGAAIEVPFLLLNLLVLYLKHPLNN